MQSEPGNVGIISKSSSIVHVSELMASSSGTEVGVEVEEEVEYVEEVVEYEEEEEEVEVEEEVNEEAKPTPSNAEGQSSSEAPALEASRQPAADEDKAEDEVPVPPPTSIAAKDGDHGEPFRAEPSASQPDGADAPAVASASTSEAAKGTTAGVGVDLDLKQLEAQAAKVAKEVSQVALDVSSKLTAGFRNAFGGGSSSSAASGADASSSSGSAAAAAAAASLTRLAGGLSSWWGSLDPAPQPVRDETAERVASSNKASSELQALFGLFPEEALVEHFRCKLLQTYAPNHNSHTPAIQMSFQGTLYVTDRHTCFCVEERGRKIPFKVPHSQVVRATRQRPARKGDLSDVLKLEQVSGQWLAFKDFESGSALDSALALVEHLAEAGSS
ncbi:hypothetical protein Agub_g11431 [Astrephomene gubernaculifera]|uniref:GRAM domain-containing protein n=1 Tax=Astrephomene gubernaculifera TaxID=47775 RepID=A0AAD3HQV2_9CHLO|nr:hypothetical protein Agub_g11431 [Astrephomene gubernaculifera]